MKATKLMRNNFMDRMIPPKCEIFRQRMENTIHFCTRVAEFWCHFKYVQIKMRILRGMRQQQEHAATMNMTLVIKKLLARTVCVYDARLALQHVHVHPDTHRTIPRCAVARGGHSQGWVCFLFWNLQTTKTHNSLCVSHVVESVVCGGGQRESLTRAGCSPQSMFLFL